MGVTARGKHGYDYRGLYKSIYIRSIWRPRHWSLLGPRGFGVIVILAYGSGTGWRT